MDKTSPNLDDIIRMTNNSKNAKETQAYIDNIDTEYRKRLITLLDIKKKDTDLLYENGLENKYIEINTNIMNLFNGLTVGGTMISLYLAFNGKIPELIPFIFPVVTTLIGFKLASGLDTYSYEKEKYLLEGTRYSLLRRIISGDYRNHKDLEKIYDLVSYVSSILQKINGINYKEIAKDLINYIEGRNLLDVDESVRKLYYELSSYK
ncbi:MAG: hypothetical protein BXU00_03255 [Candidatus Nanoclepta minutus]|uniref:SMODS and SLOG-associating 2TM effector domain-containing protein n=1 Tax=Candidatus Nanoclepta minutus TaxID=1940235 RepID=A0A397WM42_9ARCH|nr:MAG: hypothetical protein BXU00_03255 [Candidatus Nanoclepta minutus]